jgi:hypothetical protein
MHVLFQILEKLKKNNFFSLLRKIIYYPFYSKYRLQYKEMLKLRSYRERFNRIYEKNLWQSKETRSGEGSEVDYTLSLRSWLTNKLTKLKVKILVDAPCGDFNWMRMVVSSSNINYFGFDIVNSIIKKNKFYSNAKTKFAVGNICKDQLPNCDLLIVRDCLFHFCYEDINKFLKNINKIKYKYLLITNHIVEKNFINRDIITGDFRIIDLFSYPFNFDNKNVIDRVNDYPKGHRLPREMILFKKKYVPKLISYKN